MENFADLYTDYLICSTSAWVSKPFCAWLGITKEDFGFWFTLIRLIIILPVYQVLLVATGALFGQFRFFWNFEKKLLKNIGLRFLFKKTAIRN